MTIAQPLATLSSLSFCIAMKECNRSAISLLKMKCSFIATQMLGDL